MLVSVMPSIGCSGEVADGGASENVGEQVGALHEGSWPFQDQLTTAWASPHDYVALPELPLAGAAMFPASSLIIQNEHDFSIELGGSVFYKCANSQQQPGTTFEKRLPGTVSPLTNGLVIPPHLHGWVSLSCDATQRSFNVQYRARAPQGAVPFKDAVTQTGDGFNFFPFEQTRISASTPIARSVSIAVAGAGSHKLLIRYSHPHPGSPSAVVKIGVQNAATGATIKTSSNVPFAVTEQADAWKQWQLVSFDFTTSSNSTNVYARLELRNGEIVYLDAAWVL